MSNRRAFTLLEVVVSLAIVAVVTAFVVHAVQKVRSAGNTVTCQSNLRQIGDALFAYMVDNNGSYPYGYYYHPRDPVTWEPGNSEARTISWPEVINGYLVEPGDVERSERFQCPDAIAQTFPHTISYVMNMIVGVAPDAELVAAEGHAPPAQLKPSRIERMRREGTALLWDTAVHVEFGQNGLGFLVGMDLDNQRFWAGAGVPQYRYYDPLDVYGRIPPGINGNNRPIQFGFLRNVDPPSGTGYPYQGNLRFRHVDNKCNMLFSDGSVRQFTGVENTSGYVSAPDAIRRLFMTDWPPNTPRNFSVP
jgi:prepilin-type N-terminal cleavage/methylation domain-containing protein/prepilin-type processing-associated H-X9-DG protein